MTEPKKQKKTIFCKPWEGWGGWTQLAMEKQIISIEIFGFLPKPNYFYWNFCFFTKNLLLLVKKIVFWWKPNYFLWNNWFLAKANYFSRNNLFFGREHLFLVKYFFLTKNSSHIHLLTNNSFHIYFLTKQFIPDSLFDKKIIPYSFSTNK